MNATTYDAKQELVSIEPGTHWQFVYDSLAPYGLVVAGGRAGTVGVGGFISGGGNSFHSASHGMACDTVANWELVLADGTVTNANATHNADLFQAMKGGSGNFGLITRFDMYPIKFEDPLLPVIWGGNLFYDLSVGPDVIDAFVDFTDNVYKDENSSSIIYWAYLADDSYILNAAIENTKALVKPPAFDGYYSVPNITLDTTLVDAMSNITLQLGAGQPGGFRNIWFTSAFDNDARVMNHAVKKFFKLNKDLEAIMPGSKTGLNTLCMFQPITKSIAEKGVQNGGNVMGLDYYTKTNGNGVMFLLTFAVNGQHNEDVALPMLKAYMDELDRYAQSLDVWWPWRYFNYAHKSQDPLASVGQAAIKKLKAASKKYDPTGVFQRLRQSGNKISF